MISTNKEIIPPISKTIIIGIYYHHPNPDEPELISGQIRGVLSSDSALKKAVTWFW